MTKDEQINKEVNNPDHYKSHPSGIEAIEITRYLGFDLGNTWKYDMRYLHKGTPKKDLKKSIFYINDFLDKFIDFNNEMTIELHIPSFVFDLMNKVITAEQEPCVKRMFMLIYSIVYFKGVVSPKEVEETINGLKEFAEGMEA